MERNVDFRTRPNEFEMSMGHKDGSLGYGSGTQQTAFNWRQKNWGVISTEMKLPGKCFHEKVN